MAYAAGMQIGKYVLRHQLGRGGYALVFAAHDPDLDREVALKLLKSEHARSEDLVQRFLREARATVKIIHPGIVTVFECGQVAAADPEEDDTVYIAMELLDGESLADRLRRCERLAPAAAIEIGRQLAAALAAAHRAGIVHRDLKPDNVFLVEDALAPGGERAKVFDFGLAKLGRTLVPAEGQTGSLTVLGTPRYMSPEQCRSAKHIDHRTDLYALGVMLFELLAGQPPFDGQAIEVIAQHLTCSPRSLLELVPDLPPTLAGLIAQLLQKEPSARPASMEAVHRALEAIAADTGLELARPSTRSIAYIAAAPTADAAKEPAPRASGRPRRGIYAATALFAIAGSLGTYILLHGPRDAPVPAALAEGEGDPPPTHAAPPSADTTTDVATPSAPGAKPAAAPARPAAAPAKPATPAAPAFGSLTLAAKPPCEVYIDGRATGARTPLRELKLAAGKHRITLRNSEYAIQDTFTVVIGVGATERVAKDYGGQIGRDRRDATINPFAKGGR